MLARSALLISVVVVLAAAVRPEFPNVQEAVKSYVNKHGMPDAAALNPVILVPGLGGSGLEAQIDRRDVPAWYCSKQASWYPLWLDLQEIIAQSCFLANLNINWNPNNHTYTNEPGVNIRPVDFGGLDGVNCLDSHDGSWLCSLSAYYSPVSDALESIGYVADVSLFGAPYDWRLDAQSLYSQEWASDFKALVENAYGNNSNLPVYIITHSNGGPSALYFLNQQSEAWVEKYVAGFVPIAAPWGGAATALKAILSGSNFGMEFLGFSFLQLEGVATLARQAGGVMQLFPESGYYTFQNFVSTPSKNYTALDWVELLTDMGLTERSVPLFNYVDPVLDALHPPTIPSYCLYGYNTPTPVSFVYDQDWSPQNNYMEPSVINDDNLGDGTVPLESLQKCKDWADISEDVACKEYNLESHQGVLSDEQFLADLLTIVTNKWGALTCTDTPVLDAAVAERRANNAARKL